MLELAILGLLEEQALHGYELRRRLSETLGVLVSVSFGSLYPALARLEASGAVVALSYEPVGGSRSDSDRSGASAAGGGGTGSGGSAAGRGAEIAMRIPMTGSLTGERAAFRAAMTTSGMVNNSRANGGRATSRALAGHTASVRSTRQRRVYSITEAGIQMFNHLLAGVGDPGEAEDDRGFALRLAFARHLSPDARLRLLEHRRAVLTQRRARAAVTRDSTAVTDTWRCALAERGSEALDGDISWIDRLIEAERARSAMTEPAALTIQTDPKPTEPGMVSESVEPTTRKVPTS